MLFHYEFYFEVTFTDKLQVRVTIPGANDVTAGHEPLEASGLSHA